MMRTAILAAVLAAISACASPSAGPEPAPAPYTARGNEPFWRLDVTETGVTWRTPDAERQADGPAITAPTPTVPGWRGFSARFDGAALTAELIATVCQDSMSGQTYPDTVRVSFEGQTYSGCGGDPMTLLTGAWRLESAFGRPGLQGPQAATMLIEGDGRFSGTTGCNRIFGQLRVTGEGVTTEGVGSTRMACVDGPIARQEADMVQGLQGLSGFRIASDGALILMAGPGQEMRFERVAS